MADAEKTKQVIINMLSNAIKFSYPNNKVEIFLNEDDKNIRISIRDYGRGIATELLPKLFQKYSRLHTNNPDNKIIEGTGLGLYLSKKIIEIEQGTIKAESEGVNKGTTFTFTLPKVL